MNEESSLITRRNAVARMALGAAGFLGADWFAETALAELKWTVLKAEGRDYLPLREIGAFYRLGPMQQNEREFVLPIGRSSLRGEVNSQEFYISRIKFILSYPILEVDGQWCMSRMDLVKLLEPVLRPSKIPSAGRVETVVLDPGHGGHDSGAVGHLGREKDLTLDVAMRAQAAFLKAGYRVQMTRVRDEFISLEDRVLFANKFQRALFISIHFNASGNGTGIETYTLSPRGVPSMASDGPKVTDFTLCPGNARDAENMALATATHAAVVTNAQIPDRGIKRARFYVIRQTVLPSVLLEGGFVTNAEEMRKIATADYRQRLANSLLEAVTNYRKALTPNPLGSEAK